MVSYAWVRRGGPEVGCCTLRIPRLPGASFSEVVTRAGAQPGPAFNGCLAVTTPCRTAHEVGYAGLDQGCSTRQSQPDRCRAVLDGQSQLLRHPAVILARCRCALAIDEASYGPNRPGEAEPLFGGRRRRASAAAR
jgi:hypothetical protein